MAKKEEAFQVAALCYRRRKKDVEILLVKSLGRGNWILPKGWPMDDRSLAKAAATEAFEEAGARKAKSERNPSALIVTPKAKKTASSLNAKRWLMNWKYQTSRRRFPNLIFALQGGFRKLKLLKALHSNNFENSFENLNLPRPSDPVLAIKLEVSQRAPPMDCTSA